MMKNESLNKRLLTLENKTNPRRKGFYVFANKDETCAEAVERRRKELGISEIFPDEFVIAIKIE